VKHGSDSDLNPPEELLAFEGFAGDGKDLSEAFNEAWERGKSSGHRVFRVQDVFVWGENPISGYRVIITPISG
jgi:hypothetical protein